MTNDEANKVAQALQPLDQFAQQTAVGRNWHAQWQSLFAQAIRDVAAMVDKARDKPAVGQVDKRPDKKVVKKAPPE